VIVFLSTSNRDPAKFIFTYGEFGAYRVVGGNVRAMTNQAARRRNDAEHTVGQFEQELRRYLTR